MNESDLEKYILNTWNPYSSLQSSDMSMKAMGWRVKSPYSIKPTYSEEQKQKIVPTNKLLLLCN